MTEETAPAKKKLPTALKRRKQDSKKHLRNHGVKSSLHTYRVRFNKMSQEEKKSFLSTMFSSIDKAAKKGVISKQKANRLKANAAKSS